MSFIKKLPFWFNRDSKEELGAVLTAMDRELNAVHVDILKLKAEFNLNTSTTLWLDEHGSWYGVPRLLQESDEDYRKRIWKEITKGRLTIPSIISAIEELLYKGSSVSIKEPYRNIFKLSESKLSEDHWIQDGIYVSHGVIDIVINGPVPDGLRELIEELRSGGVKVFVSSSSELTDKPLIIYTPNPFPIIGFEQEIQLICKLNSDSFILSDTILGDNTWMLSGGGLNRSKYTIYIDLSKARWLRHPNSPVISYSPEYKVPDDIGFYFNATLTEKETQLKTVSHKPTNIVSMSSTVIDLRTASMASYFKVGSVLSISDLMNKTIAELDPELPKDILVETITL